MKRSPLAIICTSLLIIAATTVYLTSNGNKAEAATQAVGVECDATRAQLQERVAMITELLAATEAGREAEAHTLSSADRQGKHIRDKLVPAMARARAAADALEMVTPDDLWTLPTYTEMLFMR